MLLQIHQSQLQDYPLDNLRASRVCIWSTTIYTKNMHYIDMVNIAHLHNFQLHTCKIETTHTSVSELKTAELHLCNSAKIHNNKLTSSFNTGQVKRLVKLFMKE